MPSVELIAMVSCLQSSDSGLFWLSLHVLICLSEHWWGYDLTKIYFSLGSNEYAVLTGAILIAANLGIQPQAGRHRKRL